jgi:hypothetical protein
MILSKLSKGTDKSAGDQLTTATREQLAQEHGISRATMQKSCGVTLTRARVMPKLTGMIDDQQLTALRSNRISRRLPSIFNRRKPLPEGIVGATVVAIGTPHDPRLVEGGGLIIDYLPKGATLVRRVVLAADETAMWPVAQFELGPAG